jgi:hypothetical protein
MEPELPKVAKLPPKAEQLAWCREARAQNIEALLEYQGGCKRRIIDGEDFTQPYIRALQRDIARLDDQIAELEKKSPRAEKRPNT